MISLRMLRFFVLIPFLWSILAQANITHLGKVDLELIEIKPDGKEKTLESESGLEFSLDWKSRKCEVRFQRDKYFYCTLDTSSDIVNSKGELVMKELPQAHFSGNVVDSLIRTLGFKDRNVKKIIGKVVDDTSPARAKGFNLPFYTCGDCEKNGKDLLLWNAFQSYVIRDVPIQHAYLGSTKLLLRFKIKKMEAVPGAAYVIGNNNADQYGN